MSCTSSVPHRWRRRDWLRQAGLGTALAPLASLVTAQEDHIGGDPLGSMQWPVARSNFLGGEAMVFSDRVLVKGPPFAEDAMNVPILLDVRPLVAAGERIDRILL